MRISPALIRLPPPGWAEPANPSRLAPADAAGPPPTEGQIVHGPHRWVGERLVGAVDLDEVPAVVPRGVRVMRLCQGTVRRL
ncbi:hypothetical protein NL676_014677 [Syzygium grande]|nr:hypothetical protein NL676_014677 [Syzygium grande]